MNQQIVLLEAALYAAGRPVDIESLKKILKTKSEKKVLGLIKKLREIYSQRQSPLEIKELGRKVVLQLNSQYSKLVRKIMDRPLLSIGPLKTLSYIAYNQPISQTRVVSERGVHVYSQLKMLEEMGLIIRERIEGNEVIIKTTPYFAEYFGFNEDPVKTRLQLQKIFTELKITKIENGNGHIQNEMFTNKMKQLNLEQVDSTYPWDWFADRFPEYPSSPNRGSD
ncbi:MAG: SMC-Scp complex subunit ScpB [Candidatus Bathyarchaeia archaeon]